MLPIFSFSFAYHLEERKDICDNNYIYACKFVPPCSVIKHLCNIYNQVISNLEVIKHCQLFGIKWLISPTKTKKKTGKRDIALYCQKVHLKTI